MIIMITIGYVMQRNVNGVRMLKIGFYLFLILKLKIKIGN